jgi:hypothetical protein
MAQQPTLLVQQSLKFKTFKILKPREITGVL